MDSLQQQLRQASNDSLKVDLLNQISYSFRRSRSVDSIQSYAHWALLLAQKTNYLKGQAVALKNIGIYHYKITSPTDTIRYYYEQSRLFAERANDYYTQAACLNNLGLIESFSNETSSSILYFLKGVKVYDEHIDDAQILKGLLLGNLGSAYKNIDDQVRAYRYLHNAIEFARQHHFKPILSQYLDEYAGTLIQLGFYERADSLVEEALRIQQEIGDQLSVEPTMVEKINILVWKKEYKKAQKLALQAINDSSASGIQNYRVLFLAQLIHIALEQNQLKKAMQYAQELKATPEIVRPFRKIALDAEAKAYSANGEYEKAWDLIRQRDAVIDSMQFIEGNIEIDVLEAEYQERENLAEIDQLNQINAIEKDRFNTLMIAAIILSILLIIIFFQLRNRARNEKLIKQKNEEQKKYIDYILELENFAYIASHDLKTPLRNIVSFTQVLKRSIKPRLKPEEFKYLNFIEKGTKEISLLLEDLLAFAQNNKRQLKVEKIQLPHFVEQVISSIDVAIKEKNANINFILADEFIHADTVKLNQLLQNLLLNALKFQPPHQIPSVDIFQTTNQREWQFEIKDNGIGIEPEYQEKIFKIFKRLHPRETYEGTGIGLATCKKIVEQHGGRIWLNSTPGLGSSFFFTIPRDLALTTQ
ncbi:MAG: ATP-binding protein [Saprospiraceae bacterium]|nr:ATP-binding protein [Saprospiraceae bacterium]